MRTSLHALFAAAAAAALIACGGGSDSAAPAPPAGAPAPAPAPAPSPRRPPSPAPAPHRRPHPPQGNHAIVGIDFAQSMVFASSDAELVLAAIARRWSRSTSSRPRRRPASRRVVRMQDAAGALVGELPLNAPTQRLAEHGAHAASFARQLQRDHPGRARARGHARERVVHAVGDQRVDRHAARRRQRRVRVVTVPVQIGSTLGQVVADSERLPARAAAGRPDHAGRPCADGVGAGDHAAHHVRRVEHRVQSHPRRGGRPAPARERVVAHAVFRLHPQTNFRPGWRRLSARQRRGRLRCAKQPERRARDDGARDRTQPEPAPRAVRRPASPDPNYPYANAAMGAGNRFIWGYDARPTASSTRRRAACTTS